MRSAGACWTLTCSDSIWSGLGFFMLRPVGASIQRVSAVLGKHRIRLADSPDRSFDPSSGPMRRPLDPEIDFSVLLLCALSRSSFVP
jgi:hypothetical protein